MSMEHRSSHSTRSSSLVSTSSRHSAAESVDGARGFPNGLESGEDEDVRMAIAALGIMKAGPGALPPAEHADPSGSTSTVSNSSGWSHSGGTRSTTGTSTPAALSDHGAEDPNFMSRVSQLPLVSGGLEWYERSKASSRVVKYGAGLVESSLSSISRPLTNSLQLGQLDEFACRQLDRLGAAAEPVKSASPNFGRHDILDSADSPARGRVHHTFDDGDSVDVQPTRAESRTGVQTQQVVAVVSRSRWQTVLLEAGGLGAAVSEESLKSLRYCLQWLLYATAHLDHQITVLRDFIASLHRHGTHDSRSDALVTASASAHLTQIKHDVVDTIRKVVDVVSKYAGAALPDQAKKYVRQSILGLPVKWASAIEVGKARGRSASVASTTTERMESPLRGVERMGMNQGSEDASTSTLAPNPALRPTEDAAERVLTFAVESLEMLKSVTQIFGDSVEKAEAWIERLRIVGLDRQRERRAAQQSASPPPPPGETYAVPTSKRRRGSAPNGDATVTALSSEPDGSLRRKRSTPRSRDTMELEALE